MWFIASKSSRTAEIRRYFYFFSKLMIQLGSKNLLAYGVPEFKFLFYLTWQKELDYYL